MAKTATTSSGSRASTPKTSANASAPSAALAKASDKGTRVGIVEADSRDKTRRVVISFRAPHPKYGKYMSKRTVLNVHDESNSSHVGDVVEVGQCRPVSKSKRWALVRIVEKRSSKA